MSGWNASSHETKRHHEFSTHAAVKTIEVSNKQKALRDASQATIKILLTRDTHKASSYPGIGARDVGRNEQCAVFVAPR